MDKKEIFMIGGVGVRDGGARSVEVEAAMAPAVLRMLVELWL